MASEPSQQDVKSSNSGGKLKEDIDYTAIPTSDDVRRNEHAAEIVTELKQNLEILINKFRSSCGDTNEEMVHLKEMCSLLKSSNWDPT